MVSSEVAQILHRGVVIPAHPLALTAARKLDERRQEALTRYYCAAGVGGIAVGVHTTQFAIRDPHIGLYEPVLRLAAEVCSPGVVKVAGVCGQTPQAVREAEVSSIIGYDAGLLSLAALRDANDDELIAHCHTVAEVIPVFGFYLQPAVGGRILSYEFWRRFCDIPNVCAIKVAPFNRYQTLDVIRAVQESGRADEIALYTGNDDNIIPDLLSGPFRGGLLGQWAVWTRRAVELVERIHAANRDTDALLHESAKLTDANAALFDVRNHFAGCIAGLHEILRRQGLLLGRWCLDEHEDLSPCQMEEIERILSAYPELTDDDFVREHIDSWMR